MNDTIKTLKEELRQSKYNLIKISKVLLHELEISEDGDAATQKEINELQQRITYLEEELIQDVNKAQERPSGIQRLEQALHALREQLKMEIAIFETAFMNADKVLDLNFRIKEIEGAIESQGKH